MGGGRIGLKGKEKLKWEGKERGQHKMGVEEATYEVHLFCTAFRREV
jgi:hypothetical protein